jgi:dethiobiotin synthetase
MNGRPRQLVVIAGTGTDVGKTWVGARLAEVLRVRGLDVSARKPAQSFEPTDRITDAHVLADATGDEVHAVCPPHRCYEVPMAPPMAAAALGRPAFTIADLASEIRWPSSPDVGLVESAGGVRSPLADDGDTTTLVAALRPHQVLLVADAGLGTINGVRLSVAALDADRRGPSILVFLNRFLADDELHRCNRAWLIERCGFTVVTDIDDASRRIEAALVGSSGP